VIQAEIDNPEAPPYYVLLRAGEIQRRDLTGQLGDLKAAEDKVAATQALRDKIVAILGEDEKKAREQAAERAAAAIFKQHAIALKALHDQREQLVFIEAQAAKARAINEQGLREEAALQNTLNDAQRQSVALYEEIFSGESKMSDGMAKLIPQTQQVVDWVYKHSDSLDRFERAMDSSTAATVEGAAQSAAALIGGRKAAAIVEAAWDVAKEEVINYTRCDRRSPALPCHPSLSSPVWTGV
jgi:hypothetical protein